MGKLENKTLTEAAYQKIKDMIINMELEPGQVVSIQYLSEELDISQTPVREALINLSNDDLINYERRRKIQVSEFNEEDIKKAYEARRICETSLIKEVAKNPPVKMLKNLRRDIKKILESSSKGVYFELYHETDLELEKIVIKSIENEFITNMFDYLKNQSLRLRFLAEAIEVESRRNIIHQGSKEHLAIINALLEGNQYKAKETTINHLQKSQKRALDAFQNI